MKKMILGFYLVLAAGLATLNAGCYAHVNGAGVGVEVETHNARWHYDHDHDDNWRSQHAWHDDRNDYDH